MPKESNYFEEAYLLCNDPDLFVSNTARVLYEQMHARYVQDGFSPKEGFNILYFFQSVLRFLLIERSDVKLLSTKYPYPCEPILAINHPIESGEWNEHFGFWEKYVELVNADSTPLGDDFDIDYAVKIASSVIDKNGAVKNSTDDFDHEAWLRGFISEQA